MQKRDFISIEDFSTDEIEEIFSIADEMDKIIKNKGREDICYGKIMATLFFESSTRTRFSFEAAIQRLGGGVISAPDMSVTSTTKGETLSDTIKTVSQYADIIVIRHPLDGAVKFAAECADIPVINAGDGKHEHPTQALLDLYTLKKKRGCIKDLTVALCGDLKYGRTIHSLAYGLAMFGSKLIFIPAKDHQIPFYVFNRLSTKYNMKFRRNVFPPDFKLITDKIDVFYMTPSREEDLQHALFYKKSQEYVEEIFKEDINKLWGKYDSVYITRIQKERFIKMNEKDKIMTPKEDYPIIDGELLKDKRYKSAVVMHPLPRVDELSPEFDTDDRAIYFQQAAYGVPIRMALMAYLLEQRKIRSKPRKSDDEIVPLYNETKYISCENENCISIHEKKILKQKFKYHKRKKSNGFHALIYTCAYCDVEVYVTYAGNIKTKKYLKIHPSLDKKIKNWRNDKYLVAFKSEKEAKQCGFKPYKPIKEIIILNHKKLESGLLKIADQIRETEEIENLVFMGIEKEGKVIAERLALIIKEKESVEIPVDGLDVIDYRDDISAFGNYQNMHTEDLLSVEGKIVILVDDVVSTGRTARSALDAIIDKRIGRPKKVKLVVIIDVKNSREVPIYPDISVKSIQFRDNRTIKVRLMELENVDEVVECAATDSNI